MIAKIQLGEVKQECFDAAIRLLESRLHSRAELQRKLGRKEFGGVVIGAVLDDLTRLNYIDDARFAATKALTAAQRKQHGPRRAMLELAKAGVTGETARRAVENVYEVTDSLFIARQLAQKRAERLRKLDPIVARRRLAGMLLRRGFEYETIRPVIDEVLGDVQDGTSSD
ncbi:MAG: regulatory protein RecX [Phycisphaerae bacterium]|nr:regulatory protein RecX [Phycisphaerae bacterium]